MGETYAARFTTPAGNDVVLSPGEYYLALLGVVDFEGAWEALAAATRLVTDGQAKLELLRGRVLPLAGVLGPVGREVNPLHLMLARHWFRSQPVADAPGPSEPGA